MHRVLVEAGTLNTKVPRSVFDTLAAHFFGISAGRTLREHIETGEILGLWVRSVGSDRRGSLRVLNPTLHPSDRPIEVAA